MPLGSLAGSGLASKIFTVLPSSVVQAPGAGLQPRIRRSICCHGLPQSMRALSGAAAAFIGRLRFVLLDARRLAGLDQIDRFQHRLDPHREQAVEIDLPSVSVGPIGVFFCSRTSPVSRPLSGQKIDSPVSVSPLMIGQLIALGAAIGRQQRGMILDRAVGRDVEEFLRNKQRHERHHLQVGLERAEFLPDFRLAIGSRLIHRQLGRERRFLERIGLGAGLLRRDVDGNDLLAALEQRFEHRLAERLLPVNDDAHCRFLSPSASCPRSRASSNSPVVLGIPAFAGTRQTIVYAASAFFSGALIAPDALISAISLSE